MGEEDSEKIEDFSQCLVYFKKLGVGQPGERPLDEPMVIDRAKLIDQ